MHENILDALRRGDHDQALALARAAIDADPGDAHAHRLMAQALRLSGDHRGGLEAVDRAIAISPDDSDLHLLRAGLLLGMGKVDDGRQALDRSIGLDPNQLGAYLMQAELALGRNDLDEAERVARVASRLAPDHPVLQSVEAMVALGRGDKERALALVAAALEEVPDDPQVLNAAGFIYLANEHFAFAEQAFRRLRERKPDHHALRRALAELMYRQGRPEEALEELEPLLEMPGQASAESQRFAGEMAMRLGDPARALRWLRAALAAMPADRRTLDLAMQAWSRLGGQEDARNALEALLSTSPDVGQLWHARFSIESDPAAAAAVLERWMSAHPDAVEAHEGRMRLQMAAGDAAGAEATLRRILELAPDHEQAQSGMLDLLVARDPAAAVDFVQGLLDRSVAAGEDARQQWRLRGWLGRVHGVAGNPAGAVEAWADAYARMAETMLPLPQPTTADAPRAPAADAPADAPPLTFLVGLPGSGVLHAARLLEGVVGQFRADRFSPRPPSDPLQKIDLAQRLADGSLDPAEVAAQWRQALPARGLDPAGPVIDWLLHWDNALLDVIGPHLPRTKVLVALRDPRDMLLDWLALGTNLPLRIETPEAAATWLAGALEHVAELEQRNLHPHAVLRLDDSINAPRAMVGPLGDALGVSLPVPPEDLFGGRRYGAGQWRVFAAPLAQAFATLTPVAVRLGYPRD